MPDTREILKQIKRIELNTKKLVDTLIAGKFHSVFKGQGLEFSELREYQPGDDVRAIDWNVTARFDKPFIKVFREERELRVYFLLDISGSSVFGSSVTKKRCSIELITSLIFSAIWNNDKVGLLLFTDRIEKFVPARSGRRHALKLLSFMIRTIPKSSGTEVAAAIKYFSRIVKRTSIVFIISDFLSRDFFNELKSLNIRHDVIAIRIFDPIETSLPELGLIVLEDEETGEQILVDTSDKEFRARYNKLIAHRDSELANLFRKAKVDYLCLGTNENFYLPLKKFFKRREVLYR